MPNALTSRAPAGSSPARIWPEDSCSPMTLRYPPSPSGPTGLVGSTITLPASRCAVLGDELLEVVEPDGDHEHAGPLDRLVDAHRFGVAVEVGRDLPGGFGVPAGQEEVLTAGREVRREPAADVAGADDRHRAIRDGHLGSPFTWVVVRRSGRCAGSWWPGGSAHGVEDDRLDVLGRQACDWSSPESGDSPDRDSSGRDRSRPPRPCSARELRLLTADRPCLPLLLEVRQLTPERKSPESGDSRSP